MRNILRGLALLFLLAFVCPIFVRADETSTTTNDDTPTPQQVSDVTPRDITNGTGTARSPLLVATIADLKTALNQSIAPGESALCIKLTADIYYAFSDRGIKVSKNTVIDGDGHAILYTETRAPANGYYDYEHFSTGADNLTITLKNIKYGNATYPNSTWYGIMRINNRNTNLVIENIDYDIQKGGQPFYANNETNTLTFKGKNNFKAGTSGGGYDGEFAQGFTAINFDDDSQTTIYHDTYNELAFFWGPANQTLTVGKRALVDIKTSKQYLSYDGTSFNLNVKEKGQFSYRAISGPNHATQTASLKYTGSINMDFAKDAIGIFTTEKNGFTGQDPTISVTSPNYILFNATTSGKSVLGSIAPSLTRKDSDGYLYPIKYLKSGQKELTANMTGSRSITASNINSGESVVYARAPQLTAFNAVPAVGDDLSQITAQVTQWNPESLAAGSKINYKIATRTLYSGNNITTTTSQTSINNATAANGVRDSRSVDIATDIGKDSIYQFHDLPAQTYYVYSRLDANHITGYTLSSPWIEQVVLVPSYTKVSLPDTLDFVAPKAGEITEENHLANYLAINHGNVPVKMNLKSLALNSGSDQDVSLVAKSPKRKQIHLELLANHPTDIGDVLWDPLLIGSITGQPIELEPYWTSDHEASLYFKGEHSVTVSDGGPYHVNYKLAVSIRQVS